jgi:hypothetical protein
MIMVPANTVLLLLQQIEFYEVRRKITKMAIDMLPDSKDSNYTQEFRVLIVQRHIQLTNELIEIATELIKLETALKEVLP